MRRLSIALLMAACGGGNPGGGGDDATPDLDAAVDAPDLGPDWSVLVERGWTLSPYEDAQKCRRVRITSDMFVTGIQVIAPTGTHHTLVSVSSSGTLGDYDCQPQNLDPALLFAAGKGTNDLMFPDGVAIKLAAGSYINLNLHLYNAGDTPLTSMSSVYVKTVPQSEVVHEADMMFVGTTDIAVPGTNQPYVVNGGCAAPMTWNVFTLWPHMHAFAKRQQVQVVRAAGGSEMLLDTSYVFDEQRNYPMATKTINVNDRIDVTCTYQNDTGQMVYYGDSAANEMCFAGMYKYPKGGQTAGCIEMP